MYCPKPQQSRVSVKSPQGNYSLFAQNNSCRVPISFGYTTPQLFEGKSVTRRCWKDSYAQNFIKRWQRGITTYIALDKDRRWGGKQIGTITLTCCPYKQRLSDMPEADLAAEGFPELNAQEFIQRFFKGNDQQRVWVIRFKFTPELENGCSARISSNPDTKGNADNGCSAIGRSPGGKDCSARISSNPVSTQLSLVGNEQFFWEVGDRVYHCKDPNRTGTVIKSVKGSTRFFIAWDAGSSSAVEGRNLILAEQKPHQNPLTSDPDYLSEESGQLTIFTDDEPPDPDDFKSLDEFQQAWAEWEQAYPELAEAIATREAQTILAEQKPQTETVTSAKTRNTKPGRGSRPKQVNCNVKRNGSKGKSPNSYWVYQFSFKVDGKYFNRSCSIPKEKVNRVIEMWESKQYSWREIVEFIGKNSDTIVDEARKK
ncbi:MAG: hypothetical protein KA714_30550 [Limnoraphis sp. WC205]|jgi:hypothetical protein|nr:hypothetical protein [Limnoraphis sp. WC205]